MKKLTILGLAAASALTMGVSVASAQPYDRWGRDHDRREQGAYNINARQAQLERRIDRATRDGRISNYEAARLHRQADEFARFERRYRRDGLSNWERADLDRRLDFLEGMINSEMRDRDYGYGYGYDHRR